MGLLRTTILLLLLAAGCDRPQNAVLGRNPQASPVSILDVRKGSGQAQFTIQGIMVEKCPIAGCWLRVKDRTGTIKVDTKNAGFVVVEVPLNREVVVTGTRVMEGDEPTLQADGLRYR